MNKPGITWTIKSVRDVCLWIIHSTWQIFKRTFAKYFIGWKYNLLRALMRGGGWCMRPGSNWLLLVWARARVWALCSAPELALTPSECQRPGLGPGHSHHHDRSRDTRWSPRCPHGADLETFISALPSWWHTMQTPIKLFNGIIPSILVKNDNEVVFPENPWTFFFFSSPLRRQKHNSK